MLHQKHNQASVRIMASVRFMDTQSFSPWNSYTLLFCLFCINAREYLISWPYVSDHILIDQLLGNQNMGLDC